MAEEGGFNKVLVETNNGKLFDINVLLGVWGWGGEAEGGIVVERKIGKQKETEKWDDSVWCGVGN